ncbi:MAG: MotA/TolQ/ExbB proton channel family protein [Planctomycetaceae bacterium]
MSSQSSAKSASVDSRKSRGGSARIGIGPALVGLLLTGLFYGTAPFIPGISQFVRRYFCSHLLEVISTGMFFVGVAILLQKFRRFPAERRAVSETEAAIDEALRHRNSENRGDAERTVRDWLRGNGTSLQGTQAGLRLKETLQYVQAASREGLEEHLKYLAELAGDRLHQSYAMIRTITWAIPILGFLGTVIGITMAIANVTPEQLDSSLGEVTGGLAVAFDTTALALGMSIVMVFSSFVVERSEQSILNDVEQFGIDHLLPLFSDSQSTRGRLPQAEEVMTQALLKHSSAWVEQLSEMRLSWNEVLTEQTSQLRSRLDDDVQQTLQIHRQDSADARDGYATALQQGTSEFAERLDQMLVRFEDRISAWQHAMLASSQSAAAQSEAIHDLGRTLLKMTETEERLALLQQQLNRNLETLQFVDTLEQTAGSLTAAVHILTAKTTARQAA